MFPSFKRLLGWVAGGAVAAILAGCQPKGGTGATGSGADVLRISQRNEPADLDPALASLPDEFFVIRALSEGLVLPATHGGIPFPGAADHWESSPDGLTWTFHLRPGACWSDGEPVTADDFLYSFRRVLTPATAAPHPEVFFPVKNAEAYYQGRVRDFSEVGFSAPDTSTLVVQLEHDNPLFLSYAAAGAWIPVNARAVERYGRRWTLPGRYVGNGPYTLGEWIPNQRIVVNKNPLYWNASNIELQQIQFLRFDDGDTEERAFRSGEVDVTMAVPQTKIETYAREHPSELFRSPLAETRYLVFNTRHPPLDDPRVRQALALAIDRSRIAADVLLGGQQPAFRVMPAQLRLPDDEASALGIGAEERSPDAAARRAKQLLAEAGFPGGRGFPTFELSGWSSNPALEVIQDMWKRVLGIDVRVANREARVHVAALAAGDYDIGFITLIPQVADPLAVLRTFVSDSPDNYSHWNDFLYDGLVEAAAIAEGSRRDDLMMAAETRLMILAPISPLYYNEKIWLMRPKVRGWMENEMWTRYYPGLWIDPTKG